MSSEQRVVKLVSTLVDGDCPTRVKNRGPQPVTYGSTPAATGSTLASGSSVTVTSPTYFKASPSGWLTGDPNIDREKGDPIATLDLHPENRTIVQMVSGQTTNPFEVRSSTGSTVFSITPSGTASVSSSANNTVFDVTAAPYNAVGNGSTDDTAAIQAAINAAKAVNGTVLFPWGATGVYNYTTLACDDSLGVRLMGIGGRKQWAQGPTLNCTSAVATVAISAYRSTGFTCDSLRFTYSSTSFTGHLIELSWGAGAGDAQQWGFHNCGFRGEGTALGATSLIRLNRAIIGTIEKCHFGRAQQAINHDANYAVGIVVRDCTFNATVNAPIQTTGGAENWTVEANVFEPATNGQQGKAWRHQNGLIWGMNYNFNWHGDVGASGGSWMEIAGTGLWRSGTAMGNNFNGASQAPAISTTGASAQVESVFFAFNNLPNGTIDFSGGGSPAFTGVLMGNWGASSILGTTKIAAGWGEVQSNGPTLMANTATPRIGIGLPGDKQPQYTLDVNRASVDSRSMRLIGALYLGGTVGTADANRSFGRDANWGFDLGPGEQAEGTQNLNLILHRSNSLLPAASLPASTAALATFDESGTVRWRVTDGAIDRGYLGRYLTGATTWDPPSVAAAAQTTTTVGVTGAAVGDVVHVGFSQDLQAMQLSGYVSAAGIVTVVLRNGTAGTIDLASGTLRAQAWKH